MSGAAQVPAQQKRKLEDFLQPTAVVSKLPRAERRSPVSGADDSGDSDGDDGKISFADFLAMEHDDLAYEAVRLAERCATLEAEAQQAKKAAKIASAAAVAPAQRSEEQLRLAGERLCGIAAKQIALQFKWKPSCKQGSAKWSYDCVCEPDLHRYLLAKVNISTKKDKGKANTQKKMSVEDFCTMLGTGRHSLTGRIRYGTLSVTGERVIVRYGVEGQMLAFSGTYGL